MITFAGMNWADCAILGIIAVSALVSVLRGFVREALSLVGWILAFWVALSFAGTVATLLVDAIGAPAVRQGVAFFVLLMATLVLTALANLMAARLVVTTGLSGTDRTLGIVFGMARGTVIVAVLVMLAGLTALPQDPWWRESMLIKHFEVLAMEIRALLPPDIAAYFNFSY